MSMASNIKPTVRVPSPMFQPGRVLGSSAFLSQRSMKNTLAPRKKIRLNIFDGFHVDGEIRRNLSEKMPGLREARYPEQQPSEAGQMEHRDEIEITEDSQPWVRGGGQLRAPE